MNIKPLGKKVLVKKVDKPLKGGLILKTNNSEPFKAEVIAIGDKSDVVGLEVGQIVLVPPYSWIGIDEGTDSMLIEDNIILGVIG